MPRVTPRNRTPVRLAVLRTRYNWFLTGGRTGKPLPLQLLSHQTKFEQISSHTLQLCKTSLPSRDINEKIAPTYTIVLNLRYQTLIQSQTKYIKIKMLRRIICHTPLHITEPVKPFYCYKAQIYPSRSKKPLLTRRDIPMVFTGNNHISTPYPRIHTLIIWPKMQGKLFAH